MKKKRISVIGTGFMGKGLAMAIARQEEWELSRVLTRRNLYHCADYPYAEVLTNSIHELIEHSDLVVECSSDVLYGTDMIEQVMQAGLPVVTMNVDLQLTTGSYFAGKGIITEIEGDQPGSLAALHENVVRMGFNPLVYGNVKGFLDLNPKREDMTFWGNKQGISLDLVTSFTDGTKVQMEQALVANGLGISIAAEGLLGLPTERIEDVADILAETAKRVGAPISEYIISRQAPPGVFIIAEYDPRQKPYLNYFKMGDGPYYSIVIPFHMCHLEAMKTIHRVLSGGGALLNNSTNPSVSVAAIAKRKLQPGERIFKASGSFEFRGSTVRIDDHPNHIPIGLLNCAVLRREVEEGQMIQFDDVEIPESLAWKLWDEVMGKRPLIQVG
jgi:predicted homoserine dehydrogenase-like protein